MFTINHIKLETINSTNDYTLSLKESNVFKEGLVVTANYQSGGYGQRGKIWQSNANENLLLSVIIEPNIKIDEQFLISKIVSLSVCDLLKSFDIDAEIKWPNDILVLKQKIAGILIQNKLHGNYITHSVIGLGFNVNQLVFKTYHPKATSLRLHQNSKYEVSKIKDQFLSLLFKRLESLKVVNELDNNYLNALFLKEEIAAFESDNKQFMGIIKGVSEAGKLLVQLDDESITEFENQKIKYLF